MNAGVRSVAGQERLGCGMSTKAAANPGCLMKSTNSICSGKNFLRIVKNRIKMNSSKVAVETPVLSAMIMGWDEAGWAVPTLNPKHTP